MNIYIGIDLGGTLLKAALVDTETGELSGLKQIPTLAREGHDAVMARMADLIGDVIASSSLSKSQINGVGVGVPGVLDLEHGWVLFLPNLPGTWPTVPLQDTSESQVGLTTHLLNAVMYFVKFP